MFFENVWESTFLPFLNNEVIPVWHSIVVDHKKPSINTIRSLQEFSSKNVSKVALLNRKDDQGGFLQMKTECIWTWFRNNVEQYLVIGENLSLEERRLELETIQKKLFILYIICDIIFEPGGVPRAPFPVVLKIGDYNNASVQRMSFSEKLQIIPNTKWRSGVMEWVIMELNRIRSGQPADNITLCENLLRFLCDSVFQNRQHVQEYCLNPYMSEMEKYYRDVRDQHLEESNSKNTYTAWVVHVMKFEETISSSIKAVALDVKAILKKRIIELLIDDKGKDILNHKSMGIPTLFKDALSEEEEKKKSGYEGLKSLYSCMSLSKHQHETFSLLAKHLTAVTLHIVNIIFPSPLNFDPVAPDKYHQAKSIILETALFVSKMDHIMQTCFGNLGMIVDQVRETLRNEKFSSQIKLVNKRNCENKEMTDIVSLIVITLNDALTGTSFNEEQLTDIFSNLAILVSFTSQGDTFLSKHTMMLQRALLCGSDTSNIIDKERKFLQFLSVQDSTLTSLMQMKLEQLERDLTAAEDIARDYPQERVKVHPLLVKGFRWKEVESEKNKNISHLPEVQGEVDRFMAWVANKGPSENATTWSFVNSSCSFTFHYTNPAGKKYKTEIQTNSLGIFYLLRLIEENGHIQVSEEVRYLSTRGILRKERQDQSYSLTNSLPEGFKKKKCQLIIPPKISGNATDFDRKLGLCQTVLMKVMKSRGTIEYNDAYQQVKQKKGRWFILDPPLFKATVESIIAQEIIKRSDDSPSLLVYIA